MYTETVEGQNLTHISPLWRIYVSNDIEAGPERINYIDVKNANQEKDTTRQQLDVLTNKKGDLAVAPFTTLPNGIASPAGSAPSRGCVKSGYNASPSGAAGA